MRTPCFILLLFYFYFSFIAVVRAALLWYHIGCYVQLCILCTEMLFLLLPKASDSYTVCLTEKPDQPRFTVIKVVVDRQEPMMLQR